MYKEASPKWDKNIYKNVQTVVNIYFDDILVNPNYITEFKPGSVLFDEELKFGSTPSQYIEMQIHKKANIKKPSKVRIEYRYTNK